MRHIHKRAFTLVELLVSMAVLALLMVLISQLLNSASNVANMGNKHMDDDAQARALLDRMAIDFAAMVKRADVDYYLKGRPASNDQKNSDDQIAFYSEVMGYYASGTTTSLQSPVSLVAYRKNSGANRMERMGKGLVWNGGSGTDTPVVFLPVPLASPLPSPLPSPMPVTTPAPVWPQAADPTAADIDYEQIGPQVFRFEYYYVLKGQSAANPSILSDTPWDVRPPLSHNSVNGLQDVASIGVAIAVIDAKTRSLVTDSQLTNLAGQLQDFDNTMKPGDLESKWQKAIASSMLPHVVTSALRVYGRYFPLNSTTQ